MAITVRMTRPLSGPSYSYAPRDIVSNGAAHDDTEIGKWVTAGLCEVYSPAGFDDLSGPSVVGQTGNGAAAELSAPMLGLITAATGAAALVLLCDNLPNYADDAAATADNGLAEGSLYRVGAQVRYKVPA